MADVVTISRERSETLTACHSEEPVFFPPRWIYILPWQRSAHAATKNLVLDLTGEILRHFGAGKEHPAPPFLRMTWPEIGRVNYRMLSKSIKIILTYSLSENDWDSYEAVMEKQHAGSDFDSFLQEEGTLQEVELRAIKRVLAMQITHLMDEQRLSKLEMARRMKTSRAALDRLLDPENRSVTLQTMSRAARVLGKHLDITLT